MLNSGFAAFYFFILKCLGNVSQADCEGGRGV